MKSTTLLAESASNQSRWAESALVSESLVRAMHREVVAAGGGGLDLNFYVGCVPKIPGLGWVLKLQVWRQGPGEFEQNQADLGGGWDVGLGANGQYVGKSGVETPTIFKRERVIGAFFGEDLRRACEAELKTWFVLLRELLGRERGVAGAKILLGR